MWQEHSCMRCCYHRKTSGARRDEDRGARVRRVGCHMCHGTIVHAFKKLQTISERSVTHRARNHDTDKTTFSMSGTFVNVASTVFSEGDGWVSEMLIMCTYSYCGIAVLLRLTDHFEASWCEWTGTITIPPGDMSPLVCRFCCHRLLRPHHRLIAWNVRGRNVDSINRGTKSGLRRSVKKTQGTVAGSTNFQLFGTCVGVWAAHKFGTKASLPIQWTVSRGVYSTGVLCRDIVLIYYVML